MPLNGNPIGNMRVVLNMDNAEFGSSLDAMKRQMKVLKSDMKAQLEVFKSNDKSLEALTNRQEAYTKVVKGAEKNVELLRQRYERLAETHGENSKQAQDAAAKLNTAISEHTRYSRVLRETEADLKEVQNGTKELEDSMSLLSRETQSTVKMFRAQGNEAQALRANIDGLNKEVSERNKLIDKEKQKLSELKQQYGENSREVREQIIRIQQLETANQEARNSIGRLNDELNNGSAAGSFSKALSRIKDKAKDLSTTLSATLTPALAGLAGAASVVATDSDTAFTKMQNAMGLTGEEMEVLKSKARTLYNDGYGQSMEEITSAITEVRSNMRSLGDEDLTAATKSALSLAKTYDADINEVVRSSNNLMKNFGITSEEAFDMLIKGGQEGLNFSKEMFDNISEYSPLWADLGFSAEEMFGTLISGAEEGVYNLDYLNDMVKEFGIRILDGSKTTQDAMKTLFSPEGFFDFAQNLQKYGKDSAEYLEVCKVMGKEYTDEVIVAMRKGGKTGEDAWDGLEFNMGRGRELIQGISDGSISGQQALQEITSKIAEVDDPMQKAQLGVALMGTKFEDLGADASLGMLTAGKSLEDFDGSMDKVNKNFEESFGQRFQGFLNEAKGSLEPLGLALLDIGEKYLPPLIETLTSAANWFSNLGDGQQKLVIGTGALVAALPAIGLALTAIFTPLKLVFNGIKGLFGFFTTGATGVSGFANVISKLQVGFNLLKTGIGAAFTAVRAFLGPVGLAITIITVLWTALKYAYNHSETFRNAVDRLKVGLSNAWKAIKSFNVTATVSKMWTSVKNWFASGFNTVKSKMASIRATMSSVWTGIKNKSISVVTGMWSSVKNFFASGYNAVKSKMTSVKNTMSNIWNSIKKLTVDKVSNMIDYVKKMPQRMADAIAKGAGALKNGGKKLLKGLIGGVQWGLNKVIKGVNQVMTWVGADDSKLKPVDLTKYAKGTPNGGHDGGLAMVNDAPGSNYRELVALPNGQTFVPKGRNVVMNLPQGAEVLPGHKTRDLAKRGVIPQYKSGIGDTLSGLWSSTKSGASSLWQGTKNVGSAAFNKVKDWSTEVWDWVTSPDKVKKLLMNVIGNVLPEKYTSGMMPDMLNGLLEKMVNGAKNFVYNLTESMGGGDFGSYQPFTGNFNKISNNMGVYDFLYDLGKQIVSKFKSDYPSLYISNGKRKESKTKAGTTSDHVYGLGLDLARGGISDESYYRMAKSLQGHPYLKYVIGSDKWSKAGGAFTKFPYGGHMNHLHLSAKSPSEAKKGGSGGGAGVEQWRSVAIQALKRTGDYTPTNLKSLLRRMNQESGGNAKAINNWDSNAKKGDPSRGLMQTIMSTFKAYRDKSLSSDIYNPLANIVSSIRYTKARYGSLTKGWDRIGGYENGGLVTKHQIAQIAEGNNPEMVIPLSKRKRSRAIGLLSQTVGMMGGNAATTTDETVAKLMKEQIETNNMLVQLMTIIANKDFSTYLDGKEITTAVNNNNIVSAKRTARLGG